MSAPSSICLLRLSAIGDTTHVLPLIHAIQDHWPQTRLTWVIGRLEHKLMQGLPGVELVVYDKSGGLPEWWRLRNALTQRFDVLLNLQLAARAGLLSTAIRARRRIGYPKALSKEGHSLTIKERAGRPDGPHVLDALLGFAKPLSVPVSAPRWQLPLGEADQAWARQHVDPERPSLAVCPVSSHAARNWLPQRYAAVMSHAAQRGWQVILCGGPGASERAFCDRILEDCSAPVLDLVGRDTLKQLAAVLGRADLVMAPDTGPVHMANAMGTPVLGLYAATDPQRSGPYSDLRWTVNRYDEAAQRFMGKPAVQLPWGKKIHHPEVMALIEVDEVIARFDAFCDARA